MRVCLACRARSVIADLGLDFALCCPGYAGFSLWGPLLHHPEMPVTISRATLPSEAGGRKARRMGKAVLLPHPSLSGNHMSFPISCHNSHVATLTLFEGGQGRTGGESLGPPVSGISNAREFINELILLV